MTPNALLHVVRPSGIFAEEEILDALSRVVSPPPEPTRKLSTRIIILSALETNLAGTKNILDPSPRAGIVIDVSIWTQKYFTFIAFFIYYFTFIANIFLQLIKIYSINAIDVNFKLSVPARYVVSVSWSDSHPRFRLVATVKTGCALWIMPLANAAPSARSCSLPPMLGTVWSMKCLDLWISQLFGRQTKPRSIHCLRNMPSSRHHRMSSSPKRPAMEQCISKNSQIYYFLVPMANAALPEGQFWRVKTTVRRWFTKALVKICH